MTFLLAAAALVAAGLALLHLLRLATGRLAVDLPLGYLAGSGAFAAAAALARFGAGVPFGLATGVALLLAAPAAWAAARLRGRAGAAVGAAGEGRVLPRPLWLFAPLALYAGVVLAAVVLHGVNTPTHTDDGVRVRAFAAILAFEDGWEAGARPIFVMAGAIPTFVPALGPVLSGTLDHFHVNYAVLAELVALLALAAGLGAARGDPERGWGTAFGLLSLPLFVYHCTSTYSDAVLALRLAGAMLFAVEHARTRDRADATRAMLLLGLATLVKREGVLVAAAPAAVLAVALVRAWRRGGPGPAAPLAAFAVPAAAGLLANVLAVGLAHAFPMLALVAREMGVAAAVAPPAPPPRPGSNAAAYFVEQALFRSGNAGMIFWVLAAAVVVRGRAAVAAGLGPTLAALAALFAEVAASSIWLFPAFTDSQATVHRALFAVSVPAVPWLVAVLVDGVRAEVAAQAEPERERDGAGRATAG